MIDLNGMEKIVFTIWTGILCLGLVPANAQTPDMHSKFEQLMFGAEKEQQYVVKGHSHNDYEQNIPFFTAYYAGMESIEVDLFLRKDTLYAAHDEDEIRPGRSLEKLYLEPLASLYKKNGNRPFADSTKSLQLLIDLKEGYEKIMPPLVEILEKYRFMLDEGASGNKVRIVISGSMPPADSFDHYPLWIFFDGRPNLAYTEGQRKRLGMISDNLRSYTAWNGKGVPGKEEMQRIEAQALRAKEWGVPFRLWGAPESINTWIVLEKMGVTWLNTDHPTRLREYLDDLPKSRFKSKQTYPVYHPSYASDGKDSPVRNVILLIGDGMGLGHIQAALTANKGEVHMTQMRHVGFSKTSSYSPGNTDSGAGGSAIATGQKTYNGFLSVDTSGNPLLRLPDILAQQGIHTGILSTGDASDATPASFYASHRDRNASEEISLALRDNKGIDLLIGSTPGPYRDNLKREKFAQTIKGNGFSLLDNVTAYVESKQEKLVVYLPDSAMRPVKDGRGSILSELLMVTIDKLDGRGSGFFIMAEGAQIDYGGHARDLEYVTTETLDFDRAVGEALRFADADGHTLVIVLADHETGGLTLLDADSKHGAVHGHFASNDHSSMMIPVMAYGPGATQFMGYYENNELFNKIWKAYKN
ncbi:hypothetical protein GCM10011418_39360 [Sphingobacterium alkalisoli]|nr:hypothetical protein GCM10011418_39360 [Sphingobacterium alkalisoli]